MPTPDYYENRTEIHRKVLKEYIEYMTKVCVLLGANETDARRQMQEIMDFETKIANITIPLEERRNEEAMYHPMKLWELDKLAPFINWTEHLDHAMQLVDRHVTQKDVVIVYAPEFLKKLSHIISEMEKTKEGQK